MVGMENPFSQQFVETIENTLNRKITPVLVDKDGIIRTFIKHYNNFSSLKGISENFHSTENLEDKSSFLGSLATSNSVADFFRLIIEDAEQMGASDIHLELFEKTFTIRFRVNGRLGEYKFPDAEIAHYVLRYMKVLTNADIAQEKLPVDGKHVSIKLSNGQSVNLRISIMPTGFGFSAVIRMIVQQGFINLKDTLQDDDYYEELKSYLSLDQGLFIVSGPTGSGKSSTLYGAVSSINDSERKIITLEDPVEVKIEGLSQIQINRDIGYDFSTTLRAVLRQDPDVIMIAEVRDSETAKAAMKAAVTGHMVLTTVHTRSVRDIPLRLLDLGIDPLSIASALKLMASQRLIRVLCDHCKEPHPVNEDQGQIIQKFFPWVKADDLKNFYKAKGCQFCHNTGYQSRRVIIEHLHLTDSMVRHLADENFKAYTDEVDKALIGNTLGDNAFKLAVKGEASLNDALSYRE